MPLDFIRGMVKACVKSLINHKLLTVDLVPILPNIKGGKFFIVPDEVFYLELGHGAITVYAYLLCYEDRCTHQCHPSYNTIFSTAGLAVNTVMKYISALADKQLIAVERTSYIDDQRHEVERQQPVYDPAYPAGGGYVLSTATGQA